VKRDPEPRPEDDADELRALRDVYLALNRLDPLLYDPQRCADALASARRLTPSSLRAQIAALEIRLAALRSARAR